MSPRRSFSDIPDASALRLAQSLRAQAPARRDLAQPPRARAVFLLFFGFLLPMLATARLIGASQSDLTRRPEMNLKAMAVVAGAVVASTASGDAVQWRVQDGGNGHWYEPMAGSPMSWAVASSAALARGGHLASVTSAAESNFVVALVQAPQYWIVDGVFGMGPWIGGFQDRSSPSYSEPSGGWTWVTGEPWSWTNWGLVGSIGTEPNNGCGGEDFLQLLTQPPETGFSAKWNDGGGACGLSKSFIIEWSSDCNNDGIVDYGQCRDGTLPDYNGNNTPDCCEQGIACSVGTYPVEWRLEDGGNGHWYYWPQIEPTEGMWTVSASPTQALAFKLTVLEDGVEEAFLAARLNGFPDYSRFWIGHYRVSGGTWAWRAGASSNYLGWGDATCGAGPYPNYGYDGFIAAALHRRADCGWNWDDFAPAITPNERLLLEASADCNNDGIVDYGQILRGELADTNANGVPDICEPCIGDIVQDGLVNGIDLAAVLNNWGTKGGVIDADVNNDGIVDGSDLSIVLNGWGACP